MPRCEFCLIPKESRCKPPKKTLPQCLKVVNKFVEPDISLKTLTGLIGGEVNPALEFPSQSNHNTQPSISELLVNGQIKNHTIESAIPLYGGNKTLIVAYLVKFRTGGEAIFTP